MITPVVFVAGAIIFAFTAGIFASQIVKGTVHADVLILKAKVDALESHLFGQVQTGVAKVADTAATAAATAESAVSTATAAVADGVATATAPQA